MLLDIYVRQGSVMQWEICRELFFIFPATIIVKILVLAYNIEK